MASAMISVGDGSKRRTNTSLREISPLGERPSMMSRHTSRVAPLDAGFKVPDTPGEGSGQTPRDTSAFDTELPRRRQWIVRQPSAPSEGSGQTPSAGAASPTEPRDTDSWATGNSSHLRHTWAPPGEDHVGNNAQSVESGTLTAGYNPIYQSEWDATFRQQEYNPAAIRLLASLSVIFCLYMAGMELGTSNHDYKISGVQCLGAFLSLLFIVIFYVTSLRRFCGQHYSQLCAAWAASQAVVQMVVVVQHELRDFDTREGSNTKGAAPAIRPLSESQTLWSRYPNITFGRVDWFVRECTDADPGYNLLLPSPACSSALSSGDLMFVLCLLLLSPILFRMDVSSVRATTIIVLLVYVVSCMSVGYLNWSFFWSLMLQIVAGVSASLQCGWIQGQAKSNYAKLVSIRFSARTSQNLLHTLIPPGVMKKFRPDKNPVCTAQTINMCVVMFCMFDYKVLTRDDFDFIESLVAHLDRAVEQSGMFKYQHVCCGTCHNFIVTCPRASMEDQPLWKRMAEDVDQYPHDMIALGFDLMLFVSQITRKPFFHDIEGRERETPVRAQNLEMKIGLSAGPVAGIVMGSCRRFYCIYGDVVNTAARMCKFSKLGSIRVTKDIGTDANVSNSEWFKSVSQGLVSIKGKGHMEVYDISQSEPLVKRQKSVRAGLTKSRCSVGNTPLVKTRDDSVFQTLEDSVSEPSNIDENSHEARQMAQGKARRLEADDARLMEQEEVQWKAWLEQRHTLSRFLPIFSNVETENTYRKSKSLAFVQRKGLTMGMLFHIFSIAWEWSVFVLPDQGPIFHHYGNFELLWRMNVTQALLAGQFFMSIALSFLAFFLLGNIRMGISKVHEFCIRHRWISDPEKLMLKDEVSEATDLRKKPHSTLSLSKTIILMCNVLYIMLKILNIAVAFGLGYVWPSRRNQGLRFSLYSLSGYAVSHTIFGVSFGANGTLALISLPLAFIATYVPVHKLILGSDFAEEHEVFTPQSLFINMILLIFCSICASRHLNFHGRMRWSREHFYSERLQDVHSQLVDLVPHFYASQLMVGCKHIECLPGRVAVLQLDVCNFTVISQTLHPTKLADMINALVSDFDKHVIRHKLMKIDTIGDAYIVVVWLLSNDETDSTLDEDEIEFTNTNRCLDMLQAADGFLACLEEHREKTGIDLHGRIGIATGDVISGVLGLLQPRFCVFGEGMCHAAELEQAGVKGAAHCSSEFLEFVTGKHKSINQRKASFSAELRHEFARSKKVLNQCKSALLRRKSAATVQEMENKGRLLREGNSMTAASAGSCEEFNPIPLFSRSTRLSASSGTPGLATSIDTGTFGLTTSINRCGNFPLFATCELLLSRSIDEYGTLLVMRGMTVPDDNPATHVDDGAGRQYSDIRTATLCAIVQKTANKVDRQTSPGFDEIVPS